MESWSGRSSRISPDASPRRPSVPLRGPPASRAADPRPPRPTAPPARSAVVGRVTPTAASSSPASALNSDDLPLPVAPASAATVCSTDRLRRTPARATTARAAVHGLLGRAGPPPARPPPQRRQPVVQRRPLLPAQQLHSDAPSRRHGLGTDRPATPAGRAVSGARPDPSSSAVKRAAFLLQQRAHPLPQILTRSCGQRPHRLVAEDRLQQLLADSTLVPPAMPTSIPVSPPVEANTASISSSPAPFTPKDGDPARACAARRPRARTRSSTYPCQPRTAAAGPLRAGRRRRGRAARPTATPACSSRSRPGGRGRPRLHGAFGGAVGGGPDQRLDPALQRDPQLAVGRRAAGEESRRGGRAASRPGSPASASGRRCR